MYVLCHVTIRLFKQNHKQQVYDQVIENSNSYSSALHSKVFLEMYVVCLHE